MDGSTTTGDFCGKGNTYTIHFRLTFDHDFIDHGTWDGEVDEQGSDAKGLILACRSVLHLPPRA